MGKMGVLVTLNNCLTQSNVLTFSEFQLCETFFSGGAHVGVGAEDLLQLLVNSLFNRLGVVK